MGESVLNYHELVKPDRVKGDVYTDTRIFVDELTRIFNKSWIYIGHASEIPSPGDYKLKSIGLQEVISCRSTCESACRRRAHRS